MKPDESPSPSPDAPFEFGERTVFTLRAQPFEIEQEYGTMMQSSAPIPRETTEMPLPQLPYVESAPETPVDPIVRLEQKLDHALRLIQSLQQQLDSIDATLARALNRS